MKISLKNISNFAEGNFKYYYYRLTNYPSHIKEQILYRHELCKEDCIPKNKCIKCGCPSIKKHHVKESCNRERFPDLMDKDDWEDYKNENNIEIND